MASASVTQLLHDLGAGREEAFDELLPEVLDALRRIARRQLRGERPGHTLNTTALVNEAYLKLVADAHKDWQNRAHFFAVAARAMRQVLIGYARKRSAEKRGGGAIRVTFDEQHPPLGDTHLDTLEPRHVRVVECRFFVGLTIEETAEALGVSPVTVARDWRMARAWLRHALTEDTAPDG
ncbi:MAG: sigma-70 family RNA polymerase sigma factor [Rubricoccaceae bacterium]|nr:sigma-70 family RNA polymerase sigma factor [Rubricoccaceae bacterium]